MCGIAGLVYSDGKAVTQAELDALTDLVSHRGPDGRGTFVDGSVGLGHRRLSIIDLSESGLQPMIANDDSLVITFNGEIFNYIELRSELIQCGHRFRTGTDTEVILAAYSEWGENCVSRFNGMWAFAILDRRKKRLFLSRDRFGIKPLYYHYTPSMMVFGSEIRQLLPYLRERRTDLDRVRSFLITGALDLDNKTFFEGIEKLEAGSNLIYDLASGAADVSSYYQLERNDQLSRLDIEEVMPAFSALLDDSVRIRLRSDALVGTCLSGGLDSSTIATIASAQHHASTGGRSFSAITAISEDKDTDETPFARRVVENSQLDWLQVKPRYEDFIHSLDDVVRCQQEPFGGPSLTMQYFVMKTARENGIKVLLDGQAGDEVFLGYDKYYYAFLSEAWRVGGWAAVVATTKSIRQSNTKMGYPALAKYVLGARAAPLRYHLHLRQQPAVTPLSSTPEHLKQFSRCLQNPFELQALEIRSTNLPVLLRYEDLNSMAHGIEARLPFLDHRLVEFALSIPTDMKMRDGWTKWILRKAMSPHMPAEIAWRRNKFSFNAPDALWLRQHAAEMEQAVSSSRLLSAVTDRKKLKAGFRRLNLRSQWRLYSVALWETEFGVST